MNGIDNQGFADNVKRLRLELAELKEMVRLGAGLPGDEQRIARAQCLLTQWHVLCKRRVENHAETHERQAQVRLDFGGRTEDFTMMDPDTEWQIGETMAEALGVRLVELETLRAPPANSCVSCWSGLTRRTRRGARNWPSDFRLGDRRPGGHVDFVSGATPLGTSARLLVATPAMQNYSTKGRYPPLSAGSAARPRCGRSRLVIRSARARHRAEGDGTD
jgi:hypothetical protein